MLSVIGVALIVCFVSTPAIIPSESEIPADESDARDMLASGVLEASLWQLLRPLYRRPIDVPAGELPRLVAIVPDLDGFAPVSGSELDRYQPWDERSIDLFFEDYPLLERFRPILRFNRRQRETRTGTVGFHLCRFTDDTLASHVVNATIAPGKQLRFQCAADFTTDYARWERRLLTIDPCSAFSVEIGNGTFFSDRGLIYGALSAYRSESNDIGSNWLYGESADWNGIAVHAAASVEKNRFAPQLACFFHDRPTEMISGCNVGISVRKHLTMHFGASRMMLTGTERASYYGHGSMNLRLSRFSSDFDFGVENGNNLNVPLSWRNTVRNRGQSFELLMVMLPQGYNAPLSGLKQSFLHEMEFGDTMRSSVTLVRLSSQNIPGRPFRCTPQAEVWFESNNLHHGTFRINGVTKFDRFDGRASYSYDFGSDPEIHYPSTLSIAADYEFTPVASLSAMGRYSIDRNARQGFHVKLAPGITLFGCNRFEPFAALTMKAQSVSSMLLGISQRTTLFARTYTEFIFEKDMIDVSSEETPHVECRISFNF